MDILVFLWYKIKVDFYFYFLKKKKGHIFVIPKYQAWIWRETKEVTHRAIIIYDPLCK